MSEGLDIFGQGCGGQVVVVTRQDSGGNRSPVRVVVGLVAGVGCRQWGGCRKSNVCGIFFQWDGRQVVVTQQGSGKNGSPV